MAGICGLAAGLLALTAASPAAAEVVIQVEVLPGTGGRGFVMMLREMTNSTEPQGLADRYAGIWCEDIHGAQAGFAWTAEATTNAFGWNRPGLCEPDR